MGTQWLLLWTKFCILLTLMISWVLYVYLSFEFPSIHWLTLWDPRLGHLSLSLLSYVGRRFWDGGHEFWWSQSFAWSDWDTDGSPYPCSWTLIPRIAVWHLYFLYELSHTLSPYAYLKWEIALVLTWSYRMYYNCSILYLASCAAWFVRRLWSAIVRLFLLLVRLDLFTALCHNTLVMTHVVPSWCSSPV
jgi:hypothetical protein